MAKVLLVEDDQNLREIFSMRLQAEGYQTITAGDGEEALTIAVKEKPDLIIADVMMPRLSGFEMLETLRSAPDMASTKVIMMTALGQAEDQARGEKLGVVKYLVKSQVTLEDFVRVVHDVLQPAQTTGQEQNSSTNNKQESEKPMDDPSVPTNPAAMPDPLAAPAPADNNPISDAPVTPATPATPAADDSQLSTAQEQSTVDSQINDFASAPAAEAPAPAMPSSDPVSASDDDAMGAPADSSSVPVATPPAVDPMAPPAAPDAGAAAPTDSTSSGL
jgi:CheY-like chemotaxis protein